MIDIEQFKQQYKSRPHEYREIFRRNKITDDMLANYCGVTRPYMANVMCGAHDMSARIKAKLKPLVDQLLETEATASATEQ